jgi:uncharacterized protein
MKAWPAAAEFLAHKRIAMVGVSRDPRDFSRGLLRELRQRGYDVVPVNSQGGEVDGKPCARRVQEITPPVEGALLMTPPSASEGVVRDCAEAGVPRVWLFRGGGTGAVSEAAVTACRERGLSVVEGACPYMFLPHPGLVHRVHGWLWRRPR